MELFTISRVVWVLTRLQAEHIWSTVRVQTISTNMMSVVLAWGRSNICFFSIGPFGRTEPGFPELICISITSWTAPNWAAPRSIWTLTWAGPNHDRFTCKHAERRRRYYLFYYLLLSQSSFSTCHSVSVLLYIRTCSDLIKRFNLESLNNNYNNVRKWQTAHPHFYHSECI